MDFDRIRGFASMEETDICRNKVNRWAGVLIAWLILSKAAMADPSGAVSNPPKLQLVTAVMCEDIVNRLPFNEAVVFSIANGKVSCFTLFDPVPERTVIYHNWYYRDDLSTKIKLLINPPRWATYSSIQLREADKGPWRVEVTDSDGNVLQTIRFSITD